MPLHATASMTNRVSLMCCCLQDLTFLQLFGLYEAPERGRFSHAHAACHRQKKDIVLPHLMRLNPLMESPYFPDGLAYDATAAPPRLSPPPRPQTPDLGLMIAKLDRAIDAGLGLTTPPPPRWASRPLTLAQPEWDR